MALIINQRQEEQQKKKEEKEKKQEIKNDLVKVKKIMREKEKEITKMKQEI